MNIKKLKSIVKYNKVINFLYVFCGNLLVNSLKVFVRVNNKRILFSSFGGQKFDDSPKALYEKIINDPFFESYEMIWAFVDPSSHDLSCKKVKIDTLKYYLIALSSKFWINNSSLERGLKLKRKKTIEINTWHGTPFKKMGFDMNNNFGDHSNKMINGKEVVCAQSEFDKKIWLNFFGIKSENVIISDLPRNDFLVSYKKELIRTIKQRLLIPLDKKVILYAPTFREYDRDGSCSCFIKPPLDLKKWEETLGSNFVLLFRAHYEVVNVLGITDTSFCKNVSDYASLNELLIISDILISDYSSIFFDYSILERPMVAFMYDFDTYNNIRGLYDEPLSDFSKIIFKEEDEVIDYINNLSYDSGVNLAKKIKSKYAPNAGFACDIVIDYLKKLM